MDVKKWKGAFQKALSGKQGTKLLLLLGLFGAVLLCLPSLLGAGDRETPEPAGASAAETAEAYAERLEKKLSRMVSAMTGEESPAVLVTLENGGRYVYAADERENSRREGDSGESSKETETEHVLVKGSDGTQQALTVTKTEPKIKGVVIVSRYAGDPVIREKLTEAVKTALDLSSSKVCVTDTG